ncbi:MAG: GntR family transcriptional regulator [Acidimicrobiales bacterium]
MKVTRVVAPIRQQVTDQVRDAIIQGTFRPGQRLIERELTELTGVSRPTVREALQQLAAEGLVTTTSGKGWAVVSLSLEEAEDLYAVRALLEGLAGRRFTERATPEEIADLREAFCAIEKAADDGVDLSDAKARFYGVLFAGAGSSTIVSIISGLHARVSVLRAVSLAQPGRPRQSVEELREVIEAVEARAPDTAAKACARHVEQAARTAFSALSDDELRAP